MKTFSPYYIIIILFVLTITSCEDNYSLEGEEEISISDPLEVESTDVSGRILDINDLAVADAEIMVSYDGELTSIYSDADGNYSFSLPKDDSRILMQVHSESYLTSGIDALKLDAEKKEKNIKLLTEDEVGYVGEARLLNQNTNLIISGQVLLSDGSPASDIKMILVDISTFSFTAYDLTDENGFYSIASEPFDNYFLVAASECNGAEAIAENFSLKDQDIDFGSYQSNFSLINQFTLSGNVINCNTNEGLITGTVEIRFENNSKAYYGDINNGVYSLLVDNCLDATCYNIRITTPLFQEELSLECEPITGDQVNADYELCGEELVDSFNGEIRLLIGTDSLIYNNAAALFDPTTNQWIISSTGDNVFETVAIIFNGDAAGPVDFIFMQIEDDQLGVFQNYETSGVPINFEFTETSDNIIGAVSGQLIRQNGQLETISGTLDIEL